LSEIGRADRLGLTDAGSGRDNDRTDHYKLL